MLSKAEMLYLQGQKHFSKSYERNLKCIIKKKLETLRNELPLLSKLFDKDNLQSILEYSHTNQASKASAGPTTIHNSDYTADCQQKNCHATKFSNLESRYIERKTIKLVACEGLEGSNDLQKSIVDTEATEFSNIHTKTLRKTVNPTRKGAGRGI